MRESDERLRGRTVIAADGVGVGEITSLLFDTDGWRIDAFRVRVRRDAADRIGLGHGFFQAFTTPMLDIPVTLVQSVGDAIVLAVGVDGLRGLMPPGEHAADAPR